MTTRKYKGYLIETHVSLDNRLRHYDVSRLHDQDSVFPTKQHVARTQTLKGAKEWIDTVKRPRGESRKEKQSK